MTCEQIQLFFDDYVDDTLTPLQATAVKQHCDACANCLAQLEQLQRQKQIMALLPVPPVSDVFEQRLIKTAIETAQAEQKQHRLQSTSYKLAAVAMISALVLWLGLFNDSSVIDDKEYLVIVDNEVRTIKLAIDSEQAMDAVDLRIELSDNLEIAGLGNKKQINWTTGLQQGVNVISLPVVGIAQGRGDITTRIRVNGKEKVMRVTTEYKLPGSVLYEQKAVLQS